MTNPPHWTRSEEPPGWSLEASIEAFDRQNAMPAGIKCREDMERYDKIIRETKPDLLIECGTWKGGSARWFAERVPKVWSIDIDNPPATTEDLNNPTGVTFLGGDSADASRWAEWGGYKRRNGEGKFVDGRVMVSLDSDHTAAHVAKELAIWPRLVTPGCYLVVEDTLLHYRPSPDPKFYDLDPLVAVWDFLKTEEGQRFVVDEKIEAMFPVSQHPGGWLKAVR